MDRVQSAAIISNFVLIGSALEIARMLAAAVGQAVGSLLAPVVDAGKEIFRYAKRKHDYVKNLDSNYGELEMEARFLFSRVNDVQREIDRNRVRMQMKNECFTWLSHVEPVEGEVQSLRNRYENATNGSRSLCRFRTLYKLSKDIARKTKSIVDLKNKMNTENILVVEREPDKVQKKFAKRINDVPSLYEHVTKILDYLNDDSIKRIGISGMFGVGKTTILQNLNNEVENRNIFDIVIWVTVSKEGNRGQIQQEILERLNLSAEGNRTEAQRADIISKALEKKKYLLLLDEVFSEINLGRLGISEDHAFGKVVLATRDRLICNSMEVDEEIEVEKLSRDDAWTLFRNFVGDAAVNPTIKPVAERVLRQCGGLPQVIKAVAISLRNTPSKDAWKGTLLKLRSPNMSQLRHMEESFNAFSLFYDKLADESKKCLTYSALFPEDHEIYQDYLIECWKAEGFICRDEALSSARAIGQTLLEDLIRWHLFDRCSNPKYVKMPIIFRNTALGIAYQHSFKLLERDGEEFDDFPPEEQWRDARVVSLIHTNLQSLPERPACSLISTLFLQKNERLATIPTSFFACMSSLKILNLYGTGISSLPGSVSKLTNLRGLYLNDCHELMRLPEEIAQLKNLEVLDICRTGISGLPEVIGRLTCLRCLRTEFTKGVGNKNQIEAPSVGNENHIEAPSVSNENHTEAAQSSEVISVGTIERLGLLEELTIRVDPKESWWSHIAAGIAVEVAKLNRLSTLSFYFPSMECLEAFSRNSVPWKKFTNGANDKFRSFEILIGPYDTNYLREIDTSRPSAPRHLRYCAGEDPPEAIREVLRHACVFELIGHHNIESLSDFGIDEMKCLEVCVVQECKKMTKIIGSDAPAVAAFQWLKELRLIRLHKLNGLCEGSPVSGSFGRLTTLKICDCPNIREVLSCEIIEQLSQLQHLRVEGCSEVTEIIEASIQSGDHLPRLKILELVSLEGLRSICRNETFEWPSLEKIKIISCDRLANLSLRTNNATKLRLISCGEACLNECN
ncbi:hypothetical protein Nepgr_021611 [Nepenthes gracilis]|uniref:AAA+ ATPase domain-containing protein n=1 Tax=Nepenthes gracilis TaxID=150966 RepID=A0AAD3XXD4_NEPGR|nr:hypothetical protein Nepgr_021611 [Nepenthes gracilis]